MFTGLLQTRKTGSAPVVATRRVQAALTDADNSAPAVSVPVVLQPGQSVTPGGGPALPAEEAAAIAAAASATSGDAVGDAAPANEEEHVNSDDNEEKAPANRTPTGDAPEV